MSVPTLPVNWSGKVSDSILWLASYPRSGNTFVRILLANYFLSGDEASGIGKLPGFCPADTALPLWEAYAAIFGAPKSAEETWAARPKFFDYLRQTRDPRGFPGLKTHTVNLEFFGTRGFSFHPDDRALYIVRHPLDVVVSLADFHGKSIDQAIDELCTSGAVVHDKRLGALEVRGSWAEHVASWYLTSPCPVMLVQYEALRVDPVTALRTILGFIGAPVIEDRIALAVGASQFDKVRQQEKLNSFDETPPNTTSGAFFRKGESLQWLKALSTEQAYRLADGCGAIMQRVGYAHPRDVFFDGRNAFLKV